MYNMPRAPEGIAYAFVEAINHRDVDKLAELMSSEHRFVDPLGAVVQGREKTRAGWAAYFRMVPDYTVVVDETFSHGSIVAMLGMARGTYVKNGEPLPENSWQTPAAWRVQIQDEQVVEWRVYADNEPIRRLMAKSK
jgi:ketosteroid isomerase-like protein